MKRLLRMTVPGALILLCIAVFAAWLGLRASLPRRSGAAAVAGLRADVALEFDARGIPRIRAQSLADAFAAQGFVHAQDRYFQMDLTRRSAAGELAALLGRAAVEFDSQRRAMQLRRRAAAMLATLPQRQREYLEHYTAGVNAGLEDLGARPPEYLLLRQAPQTWQPEDSLLVVLALYTMLSNNDAYELHNGALREWLPQAMFEFVTPISARDDRPLAARTEDDPTGGYEPLPIPDSASVDLRRTDYDGNLDFVRQPPAPSGSNNWAIVGGELGHQALIANDPHLTLRVPNVFHRAELYWSAGVQRGVGIAGLPGILIGANGYVGWGATVSYADQADYVVVDVDPDDPSRYLTGSGSEAFNVDQETIEVAGRAAALEVEIRSTRWGPVVAVDHAGRPLALHATWLDANGFDLSLLDLADARNSAQALEILQQWRGPSLNWVTADTGGTIGWAINGPVPLRRNFDGSVPERWGTGAFGWRGEMLLPWTLSNHADTLYSANNRQLSLPYARTLGRFSLAPYRARAIAESLEAGRVTDERSSLELQLDTRIAAFDLLRDSILEIVAADETDPALVRARASVAEWDGYARTDSTAMPILDRYYDQLLERILGAALKDLYDADARFVYRWPLADEVLRRLLEERPAHFLPRGQSDWDGYLRDILRASLAASAAGGELPDWSTTNRLGAAHPLGAVPGLGALLRWPATALPGHPLALRVARSSFGAVIRMNVRPAAPENGILQFAGGQSGHFLSPHYADQLAEWASDRPTPFLAGATQHGYVLRPAAQNSAR